MTRHDFMLAALLTGGLQLASTGVAAADGWIDCNGPDKHGRGCSTTGNESSKNAATVGGLALVGVVALRLGRKARTRS